MKTSNLLFFISVIIFANMALANDAGTVVQIDAINGLHATVKDLLTNKVALVIHGLILLASGYAVALTKSPTPLILGILSCGLFQLAISLFVK